MPYKRGSIGLPIPMATGKTTDALKKYDQAVYCAVARS